MSSGGNRICLIVLTACFAGYLWIIYALTSSASDKLRSPEVCIFRNVTGIPCPSCGSTRSVIALTQADFHGAVMTNPLGIVVAIIMLAAPPWIITDLLSKKRSFMTFYGYVEKTLRKPPVAVLLITLLLANWIWNILKGI